MSPSRARLLRPTARRSHAAFLALLGWCVLACGLTACASRPTASAPSLPGALLADESRYIVVAVANVSGASIGHAGSTPRGYANGSDYQVSDGARRALHELANTYQLRQAAAWPIALLHLQCAVFAIPDESTRDELLERLQRDARVALAEPLHAYVLQSAPTQAAAQVADVQASSERMAITAAHRLATGRGVRIALVDTGLDTRHPALRGSVAAQRNFVDADAEQFQRDRHGTAIAGVIVARASGPRSGGADPIGVAPDAQLLALKACWQLEEGKDAARCNAFTLAQALASAVELGAQIINLSLTGPPDPLLAALAEQAITRGIIIVGAGAGDPSFPGDIAQVLQVRRSDETPSAPGALQAPGRDVLTLAPGGHYDLASGRSIATGEVSGIAALLLSRDAHLDAPRLRALLESASDLRMTHGGPDRSINACLALARLVGGADCGPALAATRPR